MQATIRDEERRDGRPLVLVAVREWDHGWLFICLPLGAESGTRSPYIVDRRDGAVYCGSSVIGSERAVEVIRSGPAALVASRRVFRVGEVGASLDAPDAVNWDYRTMKSSFATVSSGFTRIVNDN